MNPQHLLEQARHLARRSPKRPRQVDLRRAVSAAYYALFHTVCHDCAALPVGQPSSAWGQAYRAIQHGEAKRMCAAIQKRAEAPIGTREFAQAFVTLQERRHDADYDPLQTFGGSEVLKLIDMADDAWRSLLSASKAERRSLVAEIVFKKRS